MKFFRNDLIAILLFLDVSTSHWAWGDQVIVDSQALDQNARSAVMLLVRIGPYGKETPTGTGFLVSSDGLLVTDHQVIHTCQRLMAKAEDGHLFIVSRMLAEDEKADLVVLKIDTSGQPWLPLGESTAAARVGTPVAVIGSSKNSAAARFEGIVCAVRNLPNTKTSVLQISTAITPSSIGAPVLDMQGRILGVAASFVCEGQSVNVAIPAKLVKKLVVKANKVIKAQAYSPGPQTPTCNGRESTNWGALENGRPEQKPEQKNQGSSSSWMLGNMKIRPHDLFRHR